MTVATGLQCSGEAMAKVTTSVVQIGPQGTSAGTALTCPWNKAKL